MEIEVKRNNIFGDTYKRSEIECSLLNRIRHNTTSFVLENFIISLLYDLGLEETKIGEDENIKIMVDKKTFLVFYYDDYAIHSNNRVVFSYSSTTDVLSFFVYNLLGGE